MDRNQLLNDPEEAMRTALSGWQSGIWTAMPGIVTAVDFETMTLSVQPAIKGVITDEKGKTQLVNLPLLIHVPIQFPMAGGFALTLPVKPDDEVLIIWASRCIDAWWQSGGIQKPMEARMHDLSDGFAIIGISSVPNVIPNISTTSAQLRNEAGTTYLEIREDGKIKAVSPSEIELSAPIKLTGAVTITGNLNVTGNINATGEVAAKTATVPVHLSTHVHGGVTPGSGSTGAPVG
jgi:hypothetical protein